MQFNDLRLERFRVFQRRDKPVPATSANQKHGSRSNPGPIDLFPGNLSALSFHFNNGGDCSFR
jgi:hypothetical protein